MSLIRRLFRRFTCKHVWMVGICPVTLAKKSRTCERCLKTEYPSTNWGSLPWSRPAEVEDELSRMNNER